MKNCIYGTAGFHHARRSGASATGRRHSYWI